MRDGDLFGKRMRFRRRRRARSLAALAVVAGSLPLVACEELAEGLSKAVVIQYDHALNFHTYHFDQVFSAGGHEWSSIHAVDDNDNGTSERGFWALFLICSITNDGSNASTFGYDVTKLQAMLNDAVYSYGPLQPYTFRGSNGLPGTPSSTPTISEHFRQETQRGPNVMSIPPNADDALSVAYRVAVFVPAPMDEVGGQEIHELPLDLKYGGGGVLMNGRGHLPATTGFGTAHYYDLPTTCRPPAGS